MQHLYSWELFLEKEEIEDLEKKSTDKDLDQAVAKLAMEELLKQMDKDNPVIKIDQEKLKESFSKIYEEMATGAILDVLSDVGHHIHQIEQVVIGGAKQISHGDKVGGYLEKFFKSGGVKKVANFCRALSKAGHFVIGWFETFITWISRKLFGASATTSTLDFAARSMISSTWVLPRPLMPSTAMRMRSLAPIMREFPEAVCVVSAIANADGAMAATAALPAADLIKDLLELLDDCCISKFKTKTN